MNKKYLIDVMMELLIYMSIHDYDLVVTQFKRAGRTPDQVQLAQAFLDQAIAKSHNESALANMTEVEFSSFRSLIWTMIEDTQAFHAIQVQHKFMSEQK